MYSQTLIRAVALVFLVALSTSGAVAAQFDELLRRVPRAANALVVIDVDAVYKSPLAIQKRFKERYETSYVENPLIFPPEARRLVVAAYLNPLAELEPSWELAVMDLNSDLSIRSIARSEGGYVDTINTLTAAWTPSNAYFVQLEPRLLGVMYPANRQFVSRWAAFGKTNQDVELSEYLKRGAASVPAAGQIALALDLTDVPQLHRLRERLENAEALSGKKVDLDALANVILSLQGVTLNVKIGSKPTGTLRVDFDREIGLMAPFAKPLLLEAMRENEATIEDFNDWTVRVQQKSILLEGDLSQEALRRIFSLLEVPSTKFSTVSEAKASAQEVSTAEIVSASQHFFGGVGVLVEDLQKTLKENKASHAVWMERYARKIDRLPILYVDEELLAFGADVAERLRTMAVAERGANVRSGVRKSQNYGNYYSGYGGYGYYSTRSNAAQRSLENSAIKRQESARATEVRVTEWKTIEDNMADMRRKLTQKYKVEF